MTEIAVLRTHIINYAKTREVYVAYRKAGYSKKFRAEHEADILLHQTAKKAFVALTQKYVDVPELTPTIVNEYIKKIEVFAPDKSSGKRVQKVKIYFNFVDDVEIPVISEPVIAKSTPGRRKTA